MSQDTLQNRRVRALVLCTTVIAAFYLVLQTHRYAVDLPFSDDFAFVDAIAGRQAVNLAWLWEAHNEHHMMLPKLVNVVITRAFGLDFRAVAHVSALLVGIVALACVMSIARLRSRYAFEDCLVGLAVCAWAQSEAMTWTAPHNLVSTTVTLLFWWCAASAHDADRSTRSLALSALAACACVLSGASGVAALTGVLPWFVWTGLHAGRLRERIIAAATSTISVAYGVLCVMTYTRPVGHPAPASPLFTVAYFANLLASPFTRLVILQEVAGGIIGLGIAALSFRAWRSRCAQRAAAIGLATAALGVGAAVAMGRAGFGDLQIASRYITLMTPAAMAFLVLLALEHHPLLRRSLALAIAAVAIVSLSASDKAGHTSARWLQKRLAPARAEILAGRDLGEVVEAHQLYPDPVYGVAGLQALREVDGSVFRDIPSPSHP